MDAPHGVHVPKHEMTAKPGAGFHGPLEVDRIAGPQPRQGGARLRLGGHLHDKARLVDRAHRQCVAVRVAVRPGAVVVGDVDEQQQLYSEDEVRGLRLYVGKANCTQCHNGPLLTNHEFHNTGVISFPGEIPDKSRVQGVRDVMDDEFNCFGPYSDDPEPECPELVFARSDVTLIGAFKTPSLRNLQDTAPFMHKGQIATLAEVLDHYNNAFDAMVGHNEAEPLSLSSRELEQLEHFLNTLAAPVTGAFEQPSMAGASPDP